MHSSLVVLGSTGSIGVNTLKIAKQHNIQIEALVAGSNIELLNAQISEFNPTYVAVANIADIPRVNHSKVFARQDGILKLLELSNSQTVVNALVGYAGMLPTIKSIELGKKVALANKESLVVAGEFIDIKQIIPIDSEHFGLWYLLGQREPKKLYITASGGAFRDWEADQIADATYQDALNHPNWSMGSKITIDSATMTNKIFELLEAKWLFDTTDIDAFIERQSIIHALVEFMDGSTTAHLAGTDMKLPIAHALLDAVETQIIPSLDPLSISQISFEPILQSKYPIWQIKEHILGNPHLGVVLNAANEVAIEKFSQNRCTFFGMSEIVLDAYSKFENNKPSSISDIIQIDTEVRDYANRG